MNEAIGSIKDLELAQAYLQQMYGGTLEEFKTERGHTRYRFVNVSIIARHPHNAFKSVEKAMNCLFAHQLGWVANRRWAKRQDKISCQNA